MNSYIKEKMENNGYKIILIGSSGVGKSSIVHQFLFNRKISNVSPTIGAAFASKQVIAKNGKTLKLNIWDTAGQERFRSITKMYYTNSLGCLVVFDVTDRESFDDVYYWINDLRINCHTTYYILVVANKIDIDKNNWRVSENEIKKFCRDNDCDYVFASSFESDTVNNLFGKMIDKMSEIKINPDSRRNDIIYLSDKSSGIDDFIDKISQNCCYIS
ncbi:putative Rab-related GTPase [Acanthamoeba castellanii mimivirus]|uniref:Probable Rab-related GTPase n=7 Tax=Mimivirus TaxID=315393 RepID=RABL_MIMIV|nr:RecName: Full=Probable Rab-related GTPase; Flags: Precursor [Acanthamoeba polyphaga mimivirus]ALR83777.1 Rab family GTPase [Niemeyer virus]AMZ02661.1 putative Rab-related GTPase [Mimivirus Bombay]BAV61305.1 putative Rab-related GTPase [Acanthamoeba castellanii mimivirus]AAV50487.1 RAS family GTPase [Acanthamoeba polyphaga mimivirus]AEJ34450.1 RAS family GTPase [Acanthamoeba polyphaga mimivirus]